MQHSTITEYEELCQALFDLSPDGIFIADAQGHFLEINQQASDLLGYSPDELLDRSWQDVMLDESLVETTPSLDHPPFGKNMPQECWLRGKDNRLLVVEIRTRVLSDGSWLSVVHDISAHKQTEAALDASEERYRLLTENVSDVIWVLDLDRNRFRYISPSIERLRGYTVEEALAQNIADALTPEGQAYLASVLPGRLEAFHNGQVQSYIDEFEQLCKDGTTIWAEISSRFVVNETNGHLEVYGVSRDITERKQAAHALQQALADANESRHILETIMEHVPIGITLAEAPDVTTRYISRFGQKLTDPVPESLEGLPLEQHLKYVRMFRPGSTRPATNAELPLARATQQGEFVHEEEWILERADGSRIPILCTAAPIRDHMGKITGGIVGWQDITRRKQDEVALRENEERLRLALQSANQGLYDLNVQTGVAQVSPEYATILGYDPATFEETNARWIARLHPDDQEPVAATYRAYIAGEIPRYAVEFRQRTRTGAWKWILSMGKIVARDAAGNPLRMLGTHTDITERKQIETALRESEARLRMAQQCAHLGYIDIDRATRNTVWSDEVFRLLGYEPQAFQPMYQHFFVHVHPDDRPMMQQEINLLFTQQRNSQSRYRIIRPDGEVRWMYGRGEAILDAHGQPQRFIGIMIDITDSKRTEEALQVALREKDQALAQLDALFSSAPIGLGFWDTNLRFLRLNQALADINGIPSNSTIGQHLRDIVPHLDGIDDLILAWERVIATGEPLLNVEVTGTTAAWQGQRRYWLDNFFPVRIGEEIIGLGATVLDMTERKQAETALRESEEWRQRAYEVADIGTWRRDIRTNTIYFDPRSRTHYGFDTFEATLADVLARIHPDDITRLKAEIAATLDPTSTGRFFTDYRVIHPDGSVRWLSIHAHVSFAGDDAIRHPVFITATSQDITERKQAEEAIRTLNSELERRVAERTAQLATANKELEAFAYSVSHDLRAPLRAINGYTQILMEDYEPALDAEGQRVCTVIREETRRMSQLIDDLLTFSRLTRAPMQAVPIDMQQLVLEVVDNVTMLDKQQNLMLHVAPLPPAVGDATLFRQVWLNLLSNAIKFSSKQAQAVVEVSGKVVDGEIIYAVRDNGAGFDMQYVGKLFGVFQRLHSEREFPGTGVGLAIVQRIIHRHGGRVWAESVVGQGATFSFALPQGETTA